MKTIVTWSEYLQLVVEGRAKRPVLGMGDGQPKNVDRKLKAELETEARKRLEAEYGIDLIDATPDAA